jgi:hypothetical protein
MWLYAEPLRLCVFAGAAVIILANYLNLRPGRARRPA